MLDQVRSSPDTTVKATLFEDTAAMVGLVLAALGLALRRVTGSPVWDGAASIAIGGLLVAVAVRLGLDSRDFLIGRAADPKELGTIRAEIENTPGVGVVLWLVVWGPWARSRRNAYREPEAPPDAPPPSRHADDEPYGGRRYSDRRY